MLGIRIENKQRNLLAWHFCPILFSFSSLANVIFCILILTGRFKSDVTSYLKLCGDTVEPETHFCNYNLKTIKGPEERKQMEIGRQNQ